MQVELTVPSAFTVDSVTAQGAPCAVNAGTVRCSFGNLPAASVRGIDLRLRANQAGTFEVTARASAAEDSIPATMCPRSRSP